MKMNDKEFLGYLETHGQTPRALTIGRDVNRLLALAGHPEGYIEKVKDDDWFCLPLEASEPLIDMARARLAHPQCNVIPFPGVKLP